MAAQENSGAIFPASCSLREGVLHPFPGKVQARQKERLASLLITKRGLPHHPPPTRP